MIHTPRRPASLVLVIALMAAATPGQEASAAAEIEARGLLADLRSAIAAFDSPPEIAPGFPNLEASMHMLEDVAARLDLFEQTFNVRRETTKAWPEIQATAKAALTPTHTQENARYYTIDASDMNRAILQELAGDAEAALASLDNIKPGGQWVCGNWVATVKLGMMWVSGLSREPGS